MSGRIDNVVKSFFFFFSSRRRHTRWTGDWSSDVCSSDLDEAQGHAVFAAFLGDPLEDLADRLAIAGLVGGDVAVSLLADQRSEERRVGEEGRSRGGPDHYKKKK